jgi:hypothetical protein
MSVVIVHKVGLRGTVQAAWDAVTRPQGDRDSVFSRGGVRGRRCLPKNCRLRLPGPAPRHALRLRAPRPRRWTRRDRDRTRATVGSLQRAPSSRQRARLEFRSTVRWRHDVGRGTNSFGSRCDSCSCICWGQSVGGRSTRGTTLETRVRRRSDGRLSRSKLCDEHRLHGGAR